MADWRTPPGLIAAAAFVLAGMAVASFCAGGDGDDVRARLTAVVERSKARAAARDCDREAAWGETKDGSAQDLYATASRMLPAITKGMWDAETERWVEKDVPVTAEHLAELRRQWAPVVAMLTDGAHCRDARTTGANVDVHRLGWIFAAEYVGRIGEGRTTEAVHLWLDGRTVALDQGVVWLPSTPPWSDERLGALPDADLDLLAAGLVRLDRRLEPMPDAERSLANQLVPLLDGTWARRGFSANQRLAAWRHGFDAEKWQIDGLDELVQIAEVLRPAAADGAARQEQWRAYHRAPRLRATPWSAFVDGSIEATEVGHCQALTQLRLLRLAVAFHRRAPLPSLADPFAKGALEVRLDGDTAVFRSAGSFPGRQLCATRR